MPSPSTSRSPDILIVGNGISGLSLAYALARTDRSLRIAVIGPGGRPGAATLAAGAMINVWAELTPGQFDFPAQAERAELMISALPLWEPLCAELSTYAAAPLSPHWGTYLFTNAKSAPQEMRTLAMIEATLRRRGVAHEADPEVPFLRPRQGADITRSLRLPDGWIDPRAVLVAYERALRALDVAMIDGRVAALDVAGISRGARLADGRLISAAHLVLANGSFAQALIDPVPELRREVPRLLFGAGAALDLETGLRAGAVFRTSDRGGICGTHLVPMGEGRFYFGATSRVWLTPDGTPPDSMALRDVLVREYHTDFAGASIRARAIGFRPTTVDGYPLLGETHLPGVWLLNGMKRDGFTSSPFLARELARALLDQPHELPPRFKPSRSLLSYKSRAEALDEAVAANFGSIARHGLMLPPHLPDAYDATVRQVCEEIYDRRNLGAFGVPPDVLALYAGDRSFAAISHPRGAPDPPGRAD